MRDRLRQLDRVCMYTLDPLTHFWRNMRDVYLLEHMSVRVYFLAPNFFMKFAF